MTFQTKLITYIVTVVVFIILVIGGYRQWEARAVKVDIHAADQFHASQIVHGANADAHEQAATPHEQAVHILRPVIQANDDAVARDREEIQKPQSVSNDGAKDQLIKDLTKSNDDLKTALSESTAALYERTEALNERNTQVVDLQDEVKNLRAAIASTPRELKWGAGPIYGKTDLGDTAVGLGVDRDISIVRLGVEVTHNTYAIASRQGWEGRLSVKIRF